MSGHGPTAGLLRHGRADHGDSVVVRARLGEEDGDDIDPTAPPSSETEQARTRE
jgi:hypothetical protein